VSGNTLQQVEVFWYLGVVVTSRRKQNKNVDAQIGKANAILHELQRSVVRIRELSNYEKLSVKYTSLF